VGPHLKHTRAALVSACRRLQQRGGHDGDTSQLRGEGEFGDNCSRRRAGERLAAFGCGLTTAARCELSSISRRRGAISRREETDLGSWRRRTRAIPRLEASVFSYIVIQIHSKGKLTSDEQSEAITDRLGPKCNGV
jgi:hypothetical protein